MKSNRFSILVILLLVFPVLAIAQDDDIKFIGDEACECTKEISTEQVRDSIVSQINSCISSSIMANQMKSLLGSLGESTKDEANTETDSITGKKSITYTIVTDKNFDEIQGYMLENCPTIKYLMSVHEIKGKNSMSKNKKALGYYEEGLAYSAQENYDMAIVSYNKAVKKDPDFAFAWDNLGMSYRRRGNYNEAIKCYKKSLEIDPQGKMPLQNMAVAYGLLEDYKQSATAYEKYIKLYPNDPEGYFGAGRINYLAGNYEKGVDNLFKAYKLYGETQSPYIRDAQQLLASFYNDLKEKGKLDIFTEAAKNNNIQINE